MTKMRPRLLAAIAVAVALAVVSGWSTALADAPSTAAPQSANAADAASVNFGSCVRGKHHGDMLLLIDSSGSLGKSDKAAARVTAAQLLVRGLAEEPSQSGATFSVAVASFDSTYHPLLGWTSLTQGSEPDIETKLSALTDRDHGTETDYWTALTDAGKSLAARAHAEHGNTCQAIFWFTDGQFALGPHSAKKSKPYYSQPIKTTADIDKAEASAQYDLCRTGGVVDGLRSSGVVTFGFGLQAPGVHENFDLMKRIVTGEHIGSGPDKGCGSITQPSPGSFHLVTDIDSFLVGIIDILDPPGPIQTSSYQFVLDQSIRQVNMFASVHVADPSVMLRDPRGDELTFPARTDALGHTTTIGDVTVHYRWDSDRSIEAEISQPPGSSGWAGAWLLTFRKQSEQVLADLSVQLSTDLAVTWSGGSRRQLRSGSAVSVTLGLVDANGTHVPAASLLGSVSVSAALVDGNGKVVRTVASALDKDNLEQPQQLDLKGVSPGSDALRVTTTITTAPARVGAKTVAGTQLEPTVVSVPVTILTPLNYPAVGATTAGLLTGTSPRGGSTSVKGPGCVWLVEKDGRANVSVTREPDGTGAMYLTSDYDSAEHCLQVGNGTHELPVTVHVAGEGRGSGKGSIHIGGVPAGQHDAAPITSTSQLSATFRLSQSRTLQWLVMTLAMVLGIGLPLLVLYIVKRFESRVPARSLRTESFLVTVEGGALHRGNEQLRLHPDDFRRDVPVNSPTRSLELGDGRALKGRVPRSLGGPCYVVVDSAEWIGVSSISPRSAWSLRHKKLQARLPVSIVGRDGSWVLLHDPGGKPDAATLVAFIRFDTDDAARWRLFDSARAEGPGALQAACEEWDRVRNAAVPPAQSAGEPRPPAPPKRGLPSDERPARPDRTPGLPTTDRRARPPRTDAGTNPPGETRRPRGGGLPPTSQRRRPPRGGA